MAVADNRAGHPSPHGLTDTLEGHDRVDARETAVAEELERVPHRSEKPSKWSVRGMRSFVCCAKVNVAPAAQDLLALRLEIRSAVAGAPRWRDAPTFIQRMEHRNPCELSLNGRRAFEAAT
jgi:hypothetical protein